MCGTSLVVQRLGISLPMQGIWVQSLVQEDSTCCRATKPVPHNYWACALQPVLCSKRSHCNEEPVHSNYGEDPAHRNSRKTRHSTERLVSVLFSCSVVSDSLWPHESQHARPPCPSPTPGVHSTHVHRVGDAIQPSHPLLSPSSPAPNPSQH